MNANVGLLLEDIQITSREWDILQFIIKQQEQGKDVFYVDDPFMDAKVSDYIEELIVMEKAPRCLIVGMANPHTVMGTNDVPRKGYPITITPIGGAALRAPRPSQ